MPYVITPGIQTTDAGTNFDSHAVETIEEARDYIALYVCDRYAGENFGQYQDAWRDLSEASCGTIGPLPDGYVIDVRRVTYDELRGPAGLEGVQLYGLRDERRAQILDAFNGERA